MRYDPISRPILLMVLSVVAAFGPLAVVARRQDASQQPAESPKANEATPDKEKPGRARAGTKQSVEARLKAVEKPRAASPIHEVEKTLFATREFKQAVISPDGKRVAWVEALIEKDGAPSGNTAIYFLGIDGQAAPKRLRAGAGAVDHEDGNVAWSPDGEVDRVSVGCS